MYVWEFLFVKLNIYDEVFLTDINLLFFKNKLYTIYTSDEKLDDLLGQKYGNVNPDLKEKEVNFQNGYGNIFTKIESHYKKE